MKSHLEPKKVLFLDNYAPDHGFYEERLHISGQKQREKQYRRAMDFVEYFFQTQDIDLQCIYMEGIPRDDLMMAVSDHSLDLIIISGSPFNIEDKEEFPWIQNQIDVFRTFYDQEYITPIIGICFGYHVLAEAFGGTLKKACTYYHDTAKMMYTNGDCVEVVRCHQWYVSELPPDIPATVLAYSSEKEEGKPMPYQIVYDADNRKIFATLLHPEIPDEQENINTGAIDHIRSFFFS